MCKQIRGYKSNVEINVMKMRRGLWKFPWAPQIATARGRTHEEP
jgi:hypothetical protein